MRNDPVFRLAEFLSRPPGFYAILVAMAVATAAMPLGYIDVVTYILSVLAIIITGVVLIQGFRDTAAMHAKLDEIILALKDTRNSVVGLEHATPEEIEARIEEIELEAATADASAGDQRTVM